MVSGLTAAIGYGVGALVRLSRYPADPRTIRLSWRVRWVYAPLIGLPFLALAPGGSRNCVSAWGCRGSRRTT